MAGGASLRAQALAVLCEADADRKAALARAVDAAAPADAARPLAEPAGIPGRPARPALVAHVTLKQRSLKTREGHAALLHALAHIELNAIDLGWDAVYRFRGLPADFYRDWVQVADDEARHFVLLRDRLRALGCDYGDFDAHNGLWEMTEKTAHDGLARMALVPRVLEARGLDVTPGMIERLRALGDLRTVEILETIQREEVAHVAAGSRWYRWHCQRAGVEPRARFRELLVEYASGYLRGPFNIQARLLAGFDEDELASLQALAP